MKKNLRKPFFLDFALILPNSVKIENGSDQSRDCVTWGLSNCDDD